MKALKILFTVLFLSLIFVSPDLSRADNATGSKVSELNSQIIQEVRQVLQTPYLKFASKNLTGTVKVLTIVREDGKIIFTDIQGLNENLVSNVIEKLNSLNLWTSTEYSKNKFSYNIKYRD